MDSLIGFLVTLGIISVSNVSDAEQAGRPATVQIEVEAEEPDRLDLRRERIELTNAWLRSLRRVPGQKGSRTVLASGDDPNA